MLLGTRFAVFRKMPNGSIERDVGSCKTLEDALEVLMPCHVERGWKVREEYASRIADRHGKVRVVRVFDVAVDGDRVVLKRERSAA